MRALARHTTPSFLGTSCGCHPRDSRGPSHATQRTAPTRLCSQSRTLVLTLRRRENRGRGEAFPREGGVKLLAGLCVLPLHEGRRVELWSGGERGGSLPFTLALARCTAPACTLVARCEDPAKEVAALVLAVPRYPPPPLRPSRLTKNLKLSSKTTLCAVFRRCSRAAGLPLASPFFPRHSQPGPLA